MTACIATACTGAPYSMRSPHADAGALAAGATPAALNEAAQAVQPASARQAAQVVASNAPQVASPARAIIYSAEMTLDVADISATLAAIERFATNAGGYLHAQNSGAITVKVPAAQLNSVMEQAAALGEVTHRTVQAADVTEEMLDLRVRLDNAIAMRERLLALVEQSDKVEDTLKIEKELERITESIERFKGRIQYLQTHVAFSTLAVRVTSSLPQNEMRTNIPFAWVRALGDEIAGQRGQYVQTSRWKSQPIDLPAAYVLYFQEDDLVRAMSADGVMIRFDRHDNTDKAPAAFWSKLAQRHFREGNVAAVNAERTLTLKQGPAAQVITAVKQIGPAMHGYTLAIIATERHVYTLEAWGPQEAHAAAANEIDAIIASARVR